MLLKKLPIARCKSFVRSLCQTSRADFRHNLSRPVFRYACFDHFFHQRDRQRVIGRKANGPPGNLKFFQRRGTARIQRAMIRPCAEENQRASVQAESRNSVADTLLNLGRDCADGLAKFLERDPLISAYACEVFINCSRLGVHFPAYASFSFLMSIFGIGSIAFMTRSDFLASLSCNMSINTVGVTCHETPNLSLSQPHCDSSPPSAVSFSQK